MGWDKHYGYQLYQSDPSGNYGGWKATCIGNNSSVGLTLYVYSCVVHAHNMQDLVFWLSTTRHQYCLHCARPQASLLCVCVYRHDTLTSQAAVSMLKQDYKEGETDLKSAVDLAIKVLSKTLDTTKLTHEKGEILLTM